MDYNYGHHNKPQPGRLQDGHVYNIASAFPCSLRLADLTLTLTTLIDCNRPLGFPLSVFKHFLAPLEQRGQPRHSQATLAKLACRAIRLVARFASVLFFFLCFTGPSVSFSMQGPRETQVLTSHR